MFGYFLKRCLKSCHVFGSPTVNKPIFSSMSDSSRESEDQNIFIFTFLFYPLPWRIIILSSVSMMSSFRFPLLLGSILIHGTISIKVSYFTACITSEFGWVFLMRMLTLVMMNFLSSFLGVYYESLVFTSHLLFLSCYSSFFLRTFFP